MATGGPMAMNIDPIALQRLTQWFSANYPVGAYAYSHGLEAMIDQGHVTDVATFDAWLRDVLIRGSGRNDAILLAAAYRGDADVAQLSVALASSRERLLETKALGGAFAAVTESAEAATYPVAVGRAAAAEGLPLDQVLLFSINAFVSNLVTIACRAIPIGQSDGQKVLHALAPTIADLAADAARSDLSDLGTATFAADVAAIDHETQTTRIFRT